MTHKINWIKNDPEKHQWFEDGSVFLVAYVIHIAKTGKTRQDYDVVVVSCDGGDFQLNLRNGEPYDDWTWEDFDYFALIDGNIPTRRPK